MAPDVLFCHICDLLSEGEYRDCLDPIEDLLGWHNRKGFLPHVPSNLSRAAEGSPGAIAFQLGRLASCCEREEGWRHAPSTAGRAAYASALVGLRSALLARLGNAG